MSFAWLPVDVELITNHKVRRLMRRLKLDTPAHAVGYLVCLWAWAMTHAPDGDLSHLDTEDIAGSAGWTGEPDVFVAALTGSKWLDETPAGLVIHEWEDHQGQSFRKRVWEADRKRKQRDKGGTPAGHERDTSGMVGTDQTGPDQNRQETPPIPPLTQLAIDEIPATESTPEDYQRTIDRHTSRLCDRTIKQTIYELAAWEPKTPRKKLHLTLNAWLAKKPDDREPEEEEAPGYERFSVANIPDYWVQP